MELREHSGCVFQFFIITGWIDPGILVLPRKEVKDGIENFSSPIFAALAFKLLHKRLSVPGADNPGHEVKSFPYQVLYYRMFKFHLLFSYLLLVSSEEVLVPFAIDHCFYDITYVHIS